MQGILQKLNTLGFAALHELLDSAANSRTMSLPVAKQRLRELEAGKDKVDQAINESQGRINVINERKGARAARLAVLDTSITRILTGSDANKDERAKVKIAEKMRLDAEDVKDEAALQKEISSNTILTAALQAISTRNGELASRIRELEDTEHTERANAEAANTLKGVGKILAGTEADALDSTLASAKQRQATSAVALEREMQNLSAVTGKANHDDDVEDALAAYKAKLAPKDVAAA
jgi:hypothetical protein